MFGYEHYCHGCSDPTFGRNLALVEEPKHKRHRENGRPFGFCDYGADAKYKGEI